MRPIIGITGTLHPYTREVDAVLSGEGYANALAKAGAVPLVIPFLESDEDLLAVAEKLDGLLLAGGSDMDPGLFQEAPVPKLGSVSPERDHLETLLFHEMQRQGKPVFGICRGAQVINILLGGTLYQDLASQKKDVLFQHDQKAPRWYPMHEVEITPGTQLHKIFGGVDRIGVNTFHHQSVKDVAPGLVVSAVADDGVIEAIERPDGPFLLAVQWHPENMWRKQPVFLKLFESFVQACN